jgi:hypothetical protein
MTVFSISMDSHPKFELRSADYVPGTPVLIEG